MEEDRESDAGKPAEKKLEDLSIQEAFAMLEKTLAELESGEENLEETFAKYRTGMELVRLLSGKIDGIEKQLEIIENGGEDA